MFQSPGSTIFTVNGFSLHYYGLIIAVAVLAGMWITKIVAQKYYTDIPLKLFYDYTPLIMAASLIGARLYYVILDYGYFLKHPLEIFMIWNGGLSLHGGLIAGFLTAFFICKKNNLSFLRVADASVFGLLAAQAIGRWGNFFNSEAFGLPCNLPFKLYIPIEKRPFGYMNYEYFHPTFLYESFWNIILFLFLFFVIKKYFHNVKGAVFLTYLILYSVGRILIESIRTDTVAKICQIPVPTIVSAIILVAAAVVLVRNVRLALSKK